MDLIATGLVIIRESLAVGVTLLNFPASESHGGLFIFESLGCIILATTVW